eukprot:scaffold136191_cov2490-Phaeocystis_antarctica.AAC.1
MPRVLGGFGTAIISTSRGLMTDRQARNEENNRLLLEKAEDTRLSQALYGLSRTLVANMISGVGYRAQLDGKDLVLNMGYSHPVRMIPPPRISITLEGPTTVIVSGIELDVVGEFAAKIRSVRPPEPYKGKGIAYEGEVIRRKA